MNEELDDILARPPGALIQYGIAILFGIAITILAGTWFISYPEIIQGGVLVETIQPPIKEDVSAMSFSSKDRFIGKATFSIAYISKLQVGQKVSIRLDAFPSQEYGAWRGNVQSITPATQSSQCQVIVLLSDDLQFTRRIQKLPFRPALTGNIDLITRDVRIIERLLNNLLNS